MDVLPLQPRTCSFFFAFLRQLLSLLFPATHKDLIVGPCPKQVDMPLWLFLGAKSCNTKVLTVLFDINRHLTSPTDCHHCTFRPSTTDFLGCQVIDVLARFKVTEGLDHCFQQRAIRRWDALIVCNCFARYSAWDFLFPTPKRFFVALPGSTGLVHISLPTAAAAHTHTVPISRDGKTTEFPRVKSFLRGWLWPSMTSFSHRRNFFQESGHGWISLLDRGLERFDCCRGLGFGISRLEGGFGGWKDG